MRAHSAREKLHVSQTRRHSRRHVRRIKKSYPGTEDVQGQWRKGFDGRGFLSLAADWLVTVRGKAASSPARRSVNRCAVKVDSVSPTTLATGELNPSSRRLLQFLENPVERDRVGSNRCRICSCSEFRKRRGGTSLLKNFHFVRIHRRARSKNVIVPGKPIHPTCALYRRLVRRNQG